MKYETYAQYDPRAVSQTLPAFLTVWSGLGSYQSDLVLLGGLVPQFICSHPTAINSLPRPATLDVDLGIALGASAGQYGTLSTDLGAQGFRPCEKYPGRFERILNGFPLYVDFLVEDGDQPRGTRVVDDVPASVMPGVVRALETARTMTIEGRDLHGARQNVTARVCDVGPFLVLKLRAFLHRQQPKDAFDILYSLRHYEGGTDAAAKAFAAEGRAGNPAFPDAKKALDALFTNEERPGPVKAAHFVFGSPSTNDTREIELQRIQLRQDGVSAGTLLLKTVE
jgi:hypothetical protein